MEGLSGVAMAEIARREGISERGLRKYVRNLIARRAPEATGEFTALQMSRLNEALLMSFGAMSGTNLPTVDRVVRIVRELDHYQGLGRGARGTETPRKLLKSLDSGAGMAPVVPPFAEGGSREASGEDAAADGTQEIDASRRLASPLGRAGRAGRRLGESKKVPHLLENTRNRLGNGRPDAELDPGITRFWSWPPGLAANQRLRRAIMNENEVRPGVCGMRGMHKAAASHSIFVAVTKLHVLAPKPLKSPLRENSCAERSAFCARSDREQFLWSLHPAQRVQADGLERPAAFARDGGEFSRDQNVPAERLA